MKILIISYYFEPCVGIAPNRPTAFATNFSENHDVKVITRHWEGDENRWEDYLKSNPRPKEIQTVNEKLEIIRLPYISKLRTPNRLKTFMDLIFSKVDSEIDGLQFLNEASALISHWKPDYLLVSAPPLNLIKLAYLLHKKHKTPYLVDFRDFENSIILNRNNPNSPLELFSFYFRSKYALNYLKNCTYIFSINEEITNYFKGKLPIRTKVIFNGYEASIFQEFKPVKELKSDLFQISIVGTIYPTQDLYIFLDAFKLVLTQLSNPNIQFNFIGTDSIPEIGELIRKEIPEKHLKLTKRIPRLQALKYLENSHILWQPEMPGYKGMYTGKIFEYLGAKRPIIIAPSSDDVLDKLLQETNAGVSFKTAKEISTFILTQYGNWVAHGTIEYKGVAEKISQYSRESQSKKLLDSLVISEQEQNRGDLELK